MRVASGAIEPSFSVIRNTSAFNRLIFSRKSMINKVLNTTPQEALNGTTTLNTLALSKGAHVLRVHDVLEAKQAIELYKKMKA